MEEQKKERTSGWWVWGLDARVTGINARPPFSSASISLSFPFLGSVFTCFHSFRFLQGLFPSFLSVRTWNFSFLFFLFLAGKQRCTFATNLFPSHRRLFSCVCVCVLMYCLCVSFTQVSAYKYINVPCACVCIMIEDVSRFVACNDSVGCVCRSVFSFRY